MKCNLNPTNYTCDVECGRNTLTHETNGTQLHAHRQSNQSAEEKRWVLRADLNDTTEDLFLFFIRCDVECLWPGWTTKCGVEWCGEEERMV